MCIAPFKLHSPRGRVSALGWSQVNQSSVQSQPKAGRSQPKAQSPKGLEYQILKAETQSQQAAKGSFI